MIFHFDLFWTLHDYSLRKQHSGFFFVCEKHPEPRDTRDMGASKCNGKLLLLNIVEP